MHSLKEDDDPNLRLPDFNVEGKRHSNISTSQKSRKLGTKYSQRHRRILFLQRERYISCQLAASMQEGGGGGYNVSAQITPFKVF